MSLTNYNRHDSHKYWVLDTGTRSAVNGSISWTSRFIAITLGTDAEHYGSGHQDLNMPPVGFEIPVQTTVNAPAAGAPRAVTANGVQLNIWESLCYQRVPGATFATVNANYYITNSYTHHFHSNESTIVVATRTSAKIKWLDGLITDLNANDPNVPINDFWRSYPGALLPDGTADISDPINRLGKVGLGATQSSIPVALLDIGVGGRSGADLRNANDPLFVTGPLSGSNPNNAATPSNIGAKILHSNQTQGWQFCFDGITRIGSGAALAFHLRNKGAGNFQRTWESTNGPYYYNDRFGMSAAADNTGYLDRWFMAGSLAARRFVFMQAASPRNVRYQWDLFTNGTLQAGLRLEPDMAQVGNTTLRVGETRANNRKIVLYSIADTSAHEFIGFGVNNGTLRYQVNSIGNFHRFFAATSATTSNEAATIAGTGRLGINGVPAPITNLDVNGGALVGSRANAGQVGAATNGAIFNAAGQNPVTSAISADEPVLRMFREGTSGVGFSSSAEFRVGKYAAALASTSRVSLWMGLGNVSTPNNEVIRFEANNRVIIPNMPVFPNEAAATSLTTGTLYRTVTGEVRVKL